MTTKADFGRPTDYKPEYCQMLIDHMAQGFSFESFAGVIKQARSTIYLWCDKHSEFMDAKNIAQGIGLLTWEKMFVAKTRGIPEAASIDRTCLIFKMKTLGWRETDEEKGEIKVRLAYNLDDEE